jgi:stage II sporulation protein M
MLKKYYLTEWLFFKKKLRFIFLILLLLLILLSFSTYSYFIEYPERAKSTILDYVKTFRKAGLYSENNFKVFIKLFWNNLIFSLGATILGFVPFLFLPVIGIVNLSVYIGLAISLNELFIKQNQLKFLTFLSPHGVFEIPAIIYATAIGVYLSIQISRKVIPWTNRNSPPFPSLCKQAGRSFILIVVPLLLIAAFVEAFITPSQL